MKIYGILTKLSRKKIGDLTPLPVFNDKRQMYFDFYDEGDLSMKNDKRLGKNRPACYIEDISKDALSLVTRTKEPGSS